MTECPTIQSVHRLPSPDGRSFTALEKRIKQNAMYENEYRLLMGSVLEKIDSEANASSIKIEIKDAQECLVKRVIKELVRLGYGVTQGYDRVQGEYLIISWW